MDYRPLHELIELLAKRDLSPAELMESVLDRIDSTHENINAFVALRDRDQLRADAEAGGLVAAGDQSHGQDGSR